MEHIIRQGLDGNWKRIGMRLQLEEKRKGRKGPEEKVEKSSSSYIAMAGQTIF